MNMDADANNDPVNSMVSAFVDNTVCPLAPTRLVEPETVNDPLTITLPDV